VVQEPKVRAVRALRNGSRPEAPGAWLHRITRNCALDLTAARRRHPVVELADHAHPAAEDAEATVERRLGVRGLVADVGTLPDTQRSALVLRELEGRSYADIADELDVTVPAVKSLLVRARQGLKRARDDRRVAGWLPFPLLGRLLERATTAWEPVAAGATPKVACAAAVVAGSLPMIAGPATPPAPARGQTAQARAAAAPGRQVGGHRTPMTSSGAAVRRVVSLATTVALRQDCADGKIDGTYSPTALLDAFAHAGQGAEYGDCRQALIQASWRLPARG
jgi:RNA polymerase sigma factor (sigma-70 family)